MQNKGAAQPAGGRVAKLQVPTSGRILELGPGPGGMRLMELFRDNPGCSIYALEPDRNNFKKLLRAFPSSKFRGLELVEGSTRSLSGFGDSFFSRIEAHYVFTDPAFMSRHFGDGEVRDYDRTHFLRELCKTLVQMDRILAPGGKLLMSGEFKDGHSSDVRGRMIAFFKKQGYSIKFSDKHCPGTGAYCAGKKLHELMVATKPNK